MLQKAEVKDLVVQTPLDVEKVFTPEGMSGLLQDIETQVKAHVPVIDTDDGRKDIISLAYKVSQSKSLIVKTGDREVESAKKKVKAMGVLLKTAKTFLDDLRDETRKPVTEWETEQEKIKAEEDEKERLKIEKRVADLLAVESIVALLEVAVMSDDEFDCLLYDKTFEFNEAQKAKADAEAAEKKRLADEKAVRKAEADRLAKQKAEQDAKDKALQKQKDDLAAQQRAIDDQKKSMRLGMMSAIGMELSSNGLDFCCGKINTNAQNAFDIEDEYFLGLVKNLKIAIHEAAEEAAIKAKEDAKAKVEQEAKDKAESELKAKEAEERRLALLPDKELLTEWIHNFKIPNMPEIKKIEIKEIGRIGVEYIELTLNGMLKELDNI